MAKLTQRSTAGEDSREMAPKVAVTQDIGLHLDEVIADYLTEHDFHGKIAVRIELNVSKSAPPKTWAKNLGLSSR